RLSRNLTPPHSTLSSSPSPTPPPPLFPYTTLFRSPTVAMTRYVQGIHLPMIAAEEHAEGRTGVAMDLLGGRSLLLALGIEKKRADRKSTRLNSSHQIISYAVFCLKKKNSQQRPRRS